MSDSLRALWERRQALGLVWQERAAKYAELCDDPSRQIEAEVARRLMLWTAAMQKLATEKFRQAVKRDAQP